ncbi:FeoB-associated Cys-rich membrane protein [Galbibacter mesophilus]|nr:FeoB-associated Cys-rich membrane protein [Galbibacter mesophilus]MCM5662529.1 FeoB-associated Cys-rich membrane protein [Galbibacter mesophilus]
MDIQNIVVYLILFLAVAYLLLKFVFPKTLNTLLGKSNAGDCGDGNCNCH